MTKKIYLKTKRLKRPKQQHFKKTKMTKPTKMTESDPQKSQNDLQMTKAITVNKKEQVT